MVEMLGVLAIIGVLSIGGILGYTTAMDRHRANQIIDAAAKVSVIAQTSASEQGVADIGTTAGAIATGLTSMTGAAGNGIVTITWGTVSNDVRNAVNSITGNTSDASCNSANTCTINFANN